MALAVQCPPVTVQFVTAILFPCFAPVLLPLGAQTRAPRGLGSMRTASNQEGYSSSNCFDVQRRELMMHGIATRSVRRMLRSSVKLSVQGRVGAGAGRDESVCSSAYASAVTGREPNWTPTLPGYHPLGRSGPTLGKPIPTGPRATQTSNTANRQSGYSVLWKRRHESELVTQQLGAACRPITRRQTVPDQLDVLGSER
jgi:hypothetical protein